MKRPWKANPNIPIHCAICLNRTGDRVVASTIAGGYAVCDAHVELASKPDFNLARARKEQRNV